ncbi:hypothetical protein FAM09_23115 [Niastella caeni]|uniref:Uncharacterized protein n=1 Tax=Niastella caeni TaxID=2569763 RepID=A0A4V4H021_9BACT|nr:hypothetical protein [Niastella caeni]THU34886.1 hypothetical protein FAM09_23115 [Niastella caeni]
MKKQTDGDILKFLVDYLWKEMSDQSSNFFLPKLLSSQDISYDPYIAGDWDMGALPDSTNTVCTINFEPGTCIGLPTLQLSDVEIKGLYNLQPTQGMPEVNDTNVKATLNFCTLPMGTPYVTSQYITVTGNYLYSQLCKADNDEHQYITDGRGTFTTYIFEAQGYGDMDIVPDPNDPDNKLMVIMNEMKMIVNSTTSLNLCNAPGAPKNSNICISIQMDSGTSYNFLANKAANYKTVSDTIISKINEKLQDPKALKDISAMLTKQINNLAENLKEN